MPKNQGKNEPPNEEIIKNGHSLMQAIKPGTIVPVRTTEELLLFKKIELKKVSDRILEFKYIRLNKIDDAGRFCIWVELEDTKYPSKKYKPLQLIPHVGPYASNKLTGYFEEPGNPAIVRVEQTQKLYLTFATLQKNYKTTIKSCIISYIKYATIQYPLSLTQIKKLTSSSK